MLQQTITDFCKQCGQYLDLQGMLSEIICNICKTRYSLAQLVGQPVITRIKITQDKQWLLKYQPLGKKDKGIRSQNQKMLMDGKCPNCSHQKLYSMAMQTRSADQGTTVFYECPKCKYGWTANN